MLKVKACQCSWVLDFDILFLSAAEYIRWENVCIVKSPHLQWSSTTLLWFQEKVFGLPQMQFSRCISLWTFLHHPAQTPKCDFYYLATYNSLKAKKILQTSWLTLWSQFSLSNIYIHQSILALELNRVYTLEHSGCQSISNNYCKDHK